MSSWFSKSLSRKKKMGDKSCYIALPKQASSGVEGPVREYAPVAPGASSGTRLYQEEYAYGYGGGMEESYLPIITKEAAPPKKIASAPAPAANDRSMYLAPPK